ncbi:MAG: hypothetical protein LUD84_10410 [Clostridiales bacterium]|nr:hypothetical protein [Clostridiales bacterium]
MNDESKLCDTSDNCSDVLKLIPILNERHICPICSNEVNNLKECEILLHKKGEKRRIRTELLYCSSCELAYVDSELLRNIKNEHDGFWAMSFKPPKRITIETMKKRMMQTERSSKHTKKASQLLRYKKQKRMFPFAYGYEVKPSNSINSSAIRKQITLLQSGLDICPLCFRQLHEFINFIPIEVNYFVRIPGKHCLMCDRFYVPESQKGNLKNILNFPAAKEFSLLYDVLESSKFKEYFERFASNESYIKFYMLKDCKDGTLSPLIISSDARADENDPYIYHYASPEIRRLFKQIIHDGVDTVLWKDRLCHVEYQRPMLGTSFQGKAPVVQQIEISANGGYVSNNPKREIVDVLLYCPKTENYELSRATYNKEEQIYYMDLSRYRNFCRKYGKPDVSIRLPQSKWDNYGNDGWDSLNEESILHLFGYNVNQQDNLSDKTRQDILAEIIDLDLDFMKPAAIIRHLQFLIKSRETNPNQVIACGKWKRDIAFVENYRANPSRFIIAASDTKG